MAVAPIVNSILSSITLLSNLGMENGRLQGKIIGSLQTLWSEVYMAGLHMASNEGADENLTLEMQELLCDIEDFTSDLSIPEKRAASLRLAAGIDSRSENIELIDSFLENIKRIGELLQKATCTEGNAKILSPAASTTSFAAEDDLDEGFPHTKSEFLDLLSVTPAHGRQLRLISIVGGSGLGKTTLAKTVYEATPFQPFPSTAEIREPIAFNCKAWVEASTCKDAGDLLNKVLNELDPTADGRNNTSEAISKFLLNKRYLIIIDDLRSYCVQWTNIEHAFPKNDKDSIIVVTTSVHSIARDYSSGSYYVYRMQRLGEAISERLFRKKFFGACSHRHLSGPEAEHLKNILAKCDGLPPALTSAGNYLCWKDRRNPRLFVEHHDAVCHELHNILASNERAFTDMKRMFNECYNSLEDNDHKNCLLYLSLYPRGHQINSKGIARRLEAEELVNGDALKILQQLIDRSIVEPADLLRSSCNVAKRCQVHGMMLELAIYKSVSRNLVTLVDNGIVRRNKSEKKVRRLTVHSSSSSSSDTRSSNLIPDGIGLSTVRSLTIFNSKHNSAEAWVDAVKFKECKKMRSLDLEGCKGLNSSSGSLHAICELLLLKYLNLKNTDVDQLPTEVKNLKRLETLDIRQTRVAILPVEVIMLPELAHLFGEFELPLLDDRERKNLVTKFLIEKSKLHTLVGIVINKTKGFEIVIEHARNLKKVKICGHKGSEIDIEHPRNLNKVKICAPASSAPKSTYGFGGCLGFSRESRAKDNYHSSSSSFVALNESESDPPPPKHDVVASRRCVAALVSSLQKRSTSLKSVSIDSSDISKAFLASDLRACIVSSIKLRGRLTSLPRTLKNLRNLRKLHLFSTGLGSKKLVEALQNLDRLEYLKLGEDQRPGSWDGNFSVENDGFSVLRELCFEGAMMYPRVKIAEEAMSLLSSLQLLCYQSAPTSKIEDHRSPDYLMRVEGIVHLKYLDEVILHHSTDDATVQAWKEAAKNHANMPCVKKQPAQPISPAE